ncbi:hypothetical protein PaG_02487 [Moesziomyces aphidis]|uniref:Uncharacterized protein n=1 Tax=Moesziomyces aphidis TaxID=84754 RepID=W3VM99_MOEAP|nr:hypothetical protein PaG_02487 [Moesziomyces aphidis]
MNEELLSATRGLSLSPRKSPRPALQASTTKLLALSPSPHASCSGRPALATSPHQNAPHPPFGDRSDQNSASKLESPAARVSPYFNMPRGVKRPRRDLEAADKANAHVSTTLNGLHPHALSGVNAHDPIVISDDEECQPSVRVSPSTEIRSLAKKFTYESPSKAASREKAGSSSSKLQEFKPDLQSDSPVSFSAAALAKEPTASTSISKPASRSPKRQKASKSSIRPTVQPKKTVKLAQEAGVSALDLSDLTSAAFRLLTRCSFCAAAFTKSATPKAKQEHLSLCAPLHSIIKSSTALETITSDIRSAVAREQDAKRDAQANRTVFQDVVMDADLVMHEGRASQIEASSKKRGRDSVMVKKAIKRSTKPPLLLSTSKETAAIGSVTHTASSRLQSPRKAGIAARDLADHLFSEEKNPSLPPAQAHEEDSAPAFDPTAVLPATPDKRGSSSSANYDLPMVSAEEVFATLTYTSPKTSPFKALQISRQKQASRDQELMALGIGSNSVPTSPCPPPTQPFMPSKLALRRRGQDAKVCPSVFDAAATSRSLLDLVSDHRMESDDAKNEAKRKAARLDPPDLVAPAKKAKASKAEDYCVADLRLEDKHDSAVADQSSRVSLAGSPSYDMDVDAMSTGDQPSLEFPADEDHKIGKHQAQASSSILQAPANRRFKTDTSPPTSANIPQCDAIDEFVGSPALQQHDDQGIAARVDEYSSEAEEDDADDDDAQSFLDLLEPSEPYEPHAKAYFPSTVFAVQAHPQTLSPTSSDDTATVTSPPSSDRRRRMLVASGGASVGFVRRRGRQDSPHFDQVASSDPMQDQSSPVIAIRAAEKTAVTDSEPDINGATDTSSASTPQL